MDRGIKFWIKGWIKHPLLKDMMTGLAEELKLKGYIEVVAPNKLEGIITGDLESMELYVEEIIRLMENHISLLDREFVYYQAIEDYVDWIENEDDFVYQNLFKDEI